MALEGKRLQHSDVHYDRRVSAYNMPAMSNYATWLTTCRIHLDGGPDNTAISLRCVHLHACYAD